LIQRYVINYVSCLWQDGGFEQLLWFPSPMRKIVQPYHGENSIHFDDIIPAFYKHGAIDLYSILLLKQHSADRHVVPCNALT
jgi:hypothetical protein